MLVGVWSFVFGVWFLWGGGGFFGQAGAKALGVENKNSASREVRPKEPPNPRITKSGFGERPGDRVRAPTWGVTRNSGTSMGKRLGRI